MSIPAERFEYQEEERQAKAQSLPKTRLELVEDKAEEMLQEANWTDVLDAFDHTNEHRRTEILWALKTGDTKCIGDEVMHIVRDYFRSCADLKV